MRTRSFRRKELYTAVAGVGAAVAAINVSLHVYPVALIAASLAAVGVVLLGTELAPRLARALRPEIARVSRAPAPEVPALLRVTESPGGCFWGYQLGDCWTVSQDGAVDPPLCQAALESLQPVLRANRARPAGKYTVACQCPFDRKVSFAVDAQVLAAA